MLKNYLCSNKKSIKRILSIFLLLVIFPFVSFSQDLGLLIVGEKVYLQPSTLEEMVENVKEMNVNNAPKSEIASWMAKVIDYRVTNMNSLERVLDLRNTFSSEGQEIFEEWCDRNIIDNETIAKWAWSNGMGQCQETANIVYYILKQAGIPKDFRVLDVGKHQFTVWGLTPGADISNPDTWGPNAIVVDPWLGKITDSDGVKNGMWYLNGDPAIKLTDVTGTFDPNSEEWKTSANSSKSNVGNTTFKCPETNPEPGNTSDQSFPKDHEGTYVKCRYHIPNKFGKSILASKVGYIDNKKVVAEYFDSRNFLSKRINYLNGKKSEQTRFFPNGRKSSYITYTADGKKSSHEAWYEDGRKKF